MSRCLSNISILQPLCTCKRTTSLYIRRRKLSIQYCLKLSSSPQNPKYKTVFNCKFTDLFELKPTQIPPLSIRIQPDLRAVGFVKRNALMHSIPATPPWLLKWPRINYTIHQSSKDNTSPEIYRNKFFEVCDHYKDFCRLYTDGSRMGNQVAAAVVMELLLKLPDCQIMLASLEQSYVPFHLH